MINVEGRVSVTPSGSGAHAYGLSFRPFVSFVKLHLVLFSMIATPTRQLTMIFRLDLNVQALPIHCQ